MLGDEGAVELAAALATNTSLHYLELDSNRIEDHGAEALAAALRANKEHGVKKLFVQEKFQDLYSSLLKTWSDEYRFLDAGSL